MTSIYLILHHPGPVSKPTGEQQPPPAFQHMCAYAHILHYLLHKLRIQVVGIECREPLHAHTLGNESRQVVDAIRFLEVELRYHPTYCNSAIDFHVKKNSIEHCASHVLKIDVNPFWEVPENFFFGKSFIRLWLDSRKIIAKMMHITSKKAPKLSGDTAFQ